MNHRLNVKLLPEYCRNNTRQPCKCCLFIRLWRKRRQHHVCQTCNAWGK